MFWRALSVNSCKTYCDDIAFHNAVNVWLKRPNVCNKIISCCSLLPLDCFPSKTTEIHTKSEVVPPETQNYVKNLQELPFNCPFCKETQHICLNSSTNNCYFLRKLVPRRLNSYCNSYELVITSQNCYIFLPLNFDEYTPKDKADVYMIHFNKCTKCCRKVNDCRSFGFVAAYELIHEQSSSTRNLLNVNDNEYHEKLKPTVSGVLAIHDQFQHDCFVSKHWVMDKLLPKLCQWCEEEQKKKDDKSVFPPSLSLLDKEQYTILYHQLKIKYGIELSQVWPEVTDPQKYVYEDIAIATYLIILWKKERKTLGINSKQSFIDLGCGNGLLVHILTCEGHIGKGVDIRRRKIWNIYDAKTKLEEATVTPNDLALVQGYDWLLGNHSDELTPWIPVMATKCGYNVRYWVLPCCFYDFYGKYERSQSASGQYEDYLTYISHIGEKCGFEVLMDVMRIPSTKRVCFVGMTKRHAEVEQADVVDKADEFIQERFNLKSIKSSEKNFEARPKEEKVKNCTKIDRNIQTEIVQTISAHLLSQNNFVSSSKGGEWNLGGEIPLSGAILLLSDTTKQHLKKECGGLQTLLRNNNQIFEIDKGIVHIRDWSSPDQPRRKKRKFQNSSESCWKTKRCWFYDNHPNGCPRTAVECTFLHDSK